MEIKEEGKIGFKIQPNYQNSTQKNFAHAFMSGVNFLTKKFFDSDFFLTLKISKTIFADER